MARGRLSMLRAMTLLEVVIAITLIAMLSGALFTFFFQTIKVREEATIASERTAIVQGIFDRLTRELQNTVAADRFGFPDMVQFTGDRRSISFVTTPLPPSDSYEFRYESEWSNAAPPRPDLRQVSYSLWLDPEEETDEGDPIVLGILRTERWAIDPAETAEDVAEGEDLIYERHDLWAPELGYLEFRYFDGIAWSTTWNVTEGNRLPHLIQITVGFDSLTRDDNEDIDLDEFPIEEFPLGPEVPNINRFSTLVRVPAADEMYSARLNKIGDEVEEQFTSGLPDEEESEGEGS